MKKEKGMTIVEIVMVIATISILVLLIASFPNSLNLVSKSENQSLAREIAVKQIDDLRALTYLNLTLGEAPITDSRLSLLPYGSGKVIVEDCSSQICTQNEKTKKVTAQVFWKEGNKNQEIKLETLISEGGLSQ